MLSPKLGLVLFPSVYADQNTLEVYHSGHIKSSSSGGYGKIIFSEEFAQINPLNLEDNEMLSKEKLLSLIKYL